MPCGGRGGVCCWDHPTHPKENTLPNTLTADPGIPALEFQPICWNDVICRAGTGRSLLTCNPKPLSTCLSILAAHGSEENPLFPIPPDVLGLEYEIFLVSLPGKANLERFSRGFWGVFERGPPSAAGRV